MQCSLLYIYLLMRNINSIKIGSGLLHFYENLTLKAVKIFFSLFLNIFYFTSFKIYHRLIYVNKFKAFTFDINNY